MSKGKLTVCKVKCPTCPWRDESPYKSLCNKLSNSALTESRICHSTGSNAIHHRTGKESLICRGARDEQLDRFFKMGFIEAPTDEAWDKKWDEMQKSKANQQ